MNSKLIFIQFFFFLLLIIACQEDENSFTDNSNNNQEEIDDEDDYIDPGDEELITNSQEVNMENALFIEFKGEEVVVNNPFEQQVSVETNGAHIVLSSSITDKELNYILSGTTENGSLKIYGNYKYGLILNGVGITNPYGAAINNQCGKKMTVTLIDETNNRLIDGNNYNVISGEDMKATLFSEGQIIFTGNGHLEIRGKYKHAICSDDYVKFTEGNLLIKEAESDGIHANEYIEIEGGMISSRSKGEGLDCEEGYVEINGGVINIITTGVKGHGIKSYGATSIGGNSSIEIEVTGKASKGLKSDGNMTISGGDIVVTTTGDAFYDTDEADISSSAGIKCDGDLLMENGNIVIKSSGRAGKGINVDGLFTMNDGQIQINTTGAQFVYGRYDSAAKALKSDGNMIINNGRISIHTEGVEAEGMESKKQLFIHGGTVEVLAYDDCINAANHIEFTGGNIYCYSTTNDGVDSNGTITVSGGVIVSAGAGSPEGGFDCDNNKFIITGGTLIGLGGSSSSPTENGSTQYSLLYAPASNSMRNIQIMSADNGDVLIFQLPRTYNQQMTILFSDPLLKANTGYTIYTNGTISGTELFHGIYSDAVYVNGTTASTFTTSSKITKVGNVSNGGGGGRPF